MSAQRHCLLLTCQVLCILFPFYWFFILDSINRHPQFQEALDDEGHGQNLKSSQWRNFFFFLIILFEIKSTWKILHVNVSSIILWIHKYKGTECITLLSEGHSTSPGRAIMLSCLMKVQGRSCRFVYRAPQDIITSLISMIVFRSLLLC